MRSGRKGGEKEIKSARKDSALVNLRRLMSVERDLNMLLDFIIKESAKVMGAERASLFLLDKDRNELWSKIAIGSPEIIRFDADLGIAGDVLKSGKAINVEDAYGNPKFNPGVDRRTGYRTRTILCVPMKDIRGRPIGVLQALNKIKGIFSNEDVEALEVFASHAAIAVQNARFIGELEGSKKRLKQENLILKEKALGRFFVNNFVGTSTRMQDIVQLIEKVADSPLDILITGESGTGKELAARTIHYNSSRCEEPFVAINCAALPESLLESELFGIEKGVATGVERRIGKIEEANEGTLFLDEIGDMSLPAQAKLLRVLQEREIERVGGRNRIKVDVRVLAATNKDLGIEMKERNFREDLYYRLNVFHIRMPSLREIKDDIAPLAKHFLNNFTSEIGRDKVSFSAEVLKCFENYKWPGNVRELENEVKRGVILSEGNVIQKHDISEHIRDVDHIQELASNKTDSEKLKKRVERLEIQMIKDALEKTGGNKQKASEILGLTRQGLIKKLKRYKLS